MNNKIIGFTISKNKINHDDVDVFSSGLTFLSFKRGDYFIYFWGLGDLSKCSVDTQTYSLSFPLSNSLDDSNVLISFHDNKIIIKNDWLGSIPVYYSENKFIISTLINKVIDANNVNINGEGFNNYLDFGYSVFGQTPVDGVKFLLFYSELIISNGIFKVVRNNDDVFDILHNKNINFSADAVLNKIKNYINNIEGGLSSNIVLPVSGGYDSRLLGLCVNHKDKIESFTYGISSNQGLSHETVKAKFLTNKLGIKWKQIALNDYIKYYKEWFFLYGCSTHLHGMYHVDFYKKIRNTISPGASLLSGVIGDAWSGNVKIGKIKSYKDIAKLGYSHGLSINSKWSLFDKNDECYKNFFLENKEKLNNQGFCIVTSMRFKIILLSYLMKVPDYFGFLSWTPFLNKDIALSMLLLPDKDRNNRRWQTEFFKKNGVDIESYKLKYFYDNSLDMQSITLNPLFLFDLKLLKNYLHGKYLHNVLSGYLKLAKNVNLKKSKSTNFQIRLIERVKNRLRQKRMKYYYAVNILKSIEMTLKLK